MLTQTVGELTNDPTGYLQKNFVPEILNNVEICAYSHLKKVRL